MANCLESCKIPSSISQQTSDENPSCDGSAWTWVYDNTRGTSNEISSHKKSRQIPRRRIIGAIMGQLEYWLGDTVLLNTENSNDIWVAIIHEFVNNRDNEMAANFMWFSSEKEIRNKAKKRYDFKWNELYITTSWDVNPLSSINGKAIITSMQGFLHKYPSGKIPRSSKDYGKMFICRRGANTRTATYTEEFVWEDIYRGPQDIPQLVDRIVSETKATRQSRQVANTSQGLGYSEKERRNEAGHCTDASFDFGPNKSNDNKGSQSKMQENAICGVSYELNKTDMAKYDHITPSHRRITFKKALQITPLALRTLPANQYETSPFQQARSQLHVAAVPASLPCREDEFSQVYANLEAAITNASGACIYISGTPGTGKTATVREVVNALNIAVKKDELDDFIFVEINGMKITDPQQSYSLLWEALKGQRVSPSQALDLLEREFNYPSPRRIPCVVLMDELDQLVTRNQSVMYNFFNWPGLRHSKLIVLAVANTMDLPERTLSNKISSRLGLTRFQFPGYSHEQLIKIIDSRLQGIPGNLLEPDAIQFASRKVAAVSGDARRALDICRRAVEIAEETMCEAQSQIPGSLPKDSRSRADSSKMTTVTIATIRKAIKEATTSPLQQYLRSLSFASRILLVAFLMRVKKTGIAESTYGDILEEVQNAVSMGEGRIPFLLPYNHEQVKPGLTRLARAILDLDEAGILVLEARMLNRSTKVRLGISGNEIQLALCDDPEVNESGFTF